MTSPEPFDSSELHLPSTDNVLCSDDRARFETADAHRIHESGGSVPTAVIQPKRVAWPITRLWWVTLIAVIGAAVLIVTSLKSSGPVLNIQFGDGHGLRAGDMLKYRGIEIGEVTDVLLTPDHQRVAVKVKLEPKAGMIARRGSLFWIERPRLSVSRVSGLETVVGPKYLGVIPGPAGGPLATEFEGLESPPILNQSEAVEISIRFHEGHGLQIGDPLKHRGIAVGEVTAVDLSTELDAVIVRVRLVGQAHRLACEGSQFWIERPRVSIAEVRGLETIVGGRYIALLPGPVDARPQLDFDGLDTVSYSEVPAGALEIVLSAPQRWGVDRGVAVTYRGLRVGQVLSVALASDGTSIEARAYIDARYRSLVRQNSVFWSNSGVDVNFGLTGFQFSAETLSSIAQGGVAFATPPEPAHSVSTGQRFPYYKSARDEWLTWQPRISVTEEALPNRAPLPQSLRAVARWKQRSFGIRHSRERSGWILPLNNGLLLGPADLLMPTDLAANSVVLEFAGHEFAVAATATQELGSLAVFRPSKLDADETIGFPTSRIRPQASPEDCLIVTDDQSEPVPITASSLLQRDGGWEIRGTNGLTPDHHGAAVLSVKDGQLIGQLVFHRGKPTIASIERLPE